MIAPSALAAFADTLLGGVAEGSGTESGARTARVANLADVLRPLIEDAQRAHAFDVPLPVYARFVAARLPEGSAPEVALSQLRLSDLYLACGCVEGVAGAADAFVASYSRDVAKVAAKFARSRGMPEDDLVQIVMARLLLPDDERPARLSLYRGTGALGGFVQVTAARLAINASDRPSNVVEPEEKLFQRLTAPELSPESDLDQQRAKAHLRAAFAGAAGQLSARERNILFYSLCEGLSIDVLGRMYGVHRSTAARWVQDARDRLVKGTREELARRLGLSDHGVDSFMNGAMSRLELSVARFLAVETPS